MNIHLVESTRKLKKFFRISFDVEPGNPFYKGGFVYGEISNPRFIEVSKCFLLKLFPVCL